MKQVAKNNICVGTQLNLTNELVCYVTTSLKHKLSVFENVMGPVRRVRRFSPLFSSHSGVSP